MNQNALRFIKNMICAVGANISRILTTFVLMLFLPKLMTVEDYSYWQLYAFYSTYLMYTSIGWCEGTYLKYGGCDYQELNGRTIASQFWLLMVYELTVMVVIGAVSAVMMPGEPKRLAMSLALVYMVLSILRYHIQVILQATNRISEYARVYSGERLLNFVLVCLCMVTGHLQFGFIAAAEIISNGAMLFYGIFLCEEVTLRLPCALGEAVSEAKALIRIGYKITLAGLASQMIIGIVRFAIEENWGTVVFGKISLSLSMANMLITCVTAVSLVLFPVLRRSNQETAQNLYHPMRVVMTVPMFGMLMLYTPMEGILSAWLPQYEDSLRYLAIVFPFCVYETRNAVLDWTYLKLIHCESEILKANIISVAMSLILSFITVFLMGSLELAVLSIVLLYLFKNILTEWYLGKHMDVFLQKDQLMETILTVLFMAVSWYLPGAAAAGIYFCAYMFYLGINYGDIKDSLMEIKSLMCRK